jgi:hypothetical protein
MELLAASSSRRHCRHCRRRPLNTNEIRKDGSPLALKRHNRNSSLLFFSGSCGKYYGNSCALMARPIDLYQK